MPPYASSYGLHFLSLDDTSIEHREKECGYHGCHTLRALPSGTEVAIATNDHIYVNDRPARRLSSSELALAVKEDSNLLLLILDSRSKEPTDAYLYDLSSDKIERISPTVKRHPVAPILFVYTLETPRISPSFFCINGVNVAQGLGLTLAIFTNRIMCRHAIHEKFVIEQLSEGGNVLAIYSTEFHPLAVFANVAGKGFAPICP